MKPSSSIFRKTALLTLGMFGVIALLTSTMSAYILYSRLTEEFISKGTAIASSIASSSQETLLAHDAVIIQSMIDQYLDIEGVSYVFVLNADMEVVAHTFVPTVPLEVLRHPMGKHSQRVLALDLDRYGKVIDICQPILNGVAGYVHVGMNKDLLVSYFWTTVGSMQGLVLLIFLACSLVLYSMTRKITRPLKELSDYSEQLANRNFSAPVHIHANDEVGQLGRTMQFMAHELQDMFTDMEQQIKNATEDLRENMSYLQAIIDNLADGLLVVSPAGVVTLVNPAIREFFDLDDQDYQGWKVDKLFPMEIVDMAGKIKTCREGLMSAEIALNRGRTGYALGTSIFSQEGREVCLGGVILIRDITREKELDRLKTDFISTVSHELRTPMTSVLGFTKIIRKRLDQVILPLLPKGDSSVDRAVGQVLQNMDIIVSEGERLTELINDVLDIAKMESGKIEWKDQILVMEDLVTHAVNSTRSLFMDKRLNVTVNVENELPPIKGDRSRLVQVILNILSNAVKFTEAGTIECRVYRDGENIVTSIKDPGKGINPEQLDTIFDKFKQVGDTLTEKPTGSGLGLAICKQIVTRHGGRIWAHSVPGHGSTLIFTLPAYRGKGLAEDPAPFPEICDIDGVDRDGKAMLVEPERPDDHTPRILVVDDDPMVGEMLQQIFQGENFQVELASNGYEALAKAEQAIPSLITMDLMMPGMDGRTTIKCLRQNPFTRHIPILVISALDNIQTDGDIVLSKPVDEDRLIQVVRSLLLQKNLRRSCLVLGESHHVDVDDLKVVCPGRVVFCPPDEIWQRVEDGFTGTIFIPAEIVQQFEIERLARLPGVEVVVLPTRV